MVVHSYCLVSPSFLFQKLSFIQKAVVSTALRSYDLKGSECLIESILQGESNHPSIHSYNHLSLHTWQKQVGKDAKDVWDAVDDDDDDDDFRCSSCSKFCG